MGETAATDSHILATEPKKLGISEAIGVSQVLFHVTFVSFVKSCFCKRVV